MPSSKCVVRGSINHDEYFFVDEITKPGETKSSKRHASRVGGKGANQAVAIARAGGEVEFYGTVGKDGDWIVEEMKGHGIDVAGILVSEEPTGRAIIQVSDDGENSIILFAGANHSEAHEKREKSSHDSWFLGASHLLLQNEISFQSTLTSLERAKEEGLCTIFNPSPMLSQAAIPDFPWEKVDWLLINEGEGLALLEGLAKKSDLFDATGELKAEMTDIEHPQLSKRASANEVIARLILLHPAFRTMNVVYTLGSEGVVGFVPSLDVADRTVYVPAAKVEGGVKDTTGAGDCFAGYFIAGLMQRGEGGLRREDVVEILRVCNQAAGISVESPGTIESIPTRAMVEARMVKLG
ncbi:hypothetical protein D9611_007278 [Ephemerocybe angulata]|uniref:Ribokinase n=1 Tax=Ephemerocybe angulata TaxID=980116 RepID=A0A8H5EWB4_9AGAR|nr:hypothetical protein D9611_007278 [Tulosesus angulatus]